MIPDIGGSGFSGGGGFGKFGFQNTNNPLTPRIAYIGDSFGQQEIGGTANAGLTSAISDRIDAMGRGMMYHLLGKNRNFEFANFNWADGGGKYVVGGVNKRAYHSGANMCVGGASTYGSVIDGYDADGTTPKQLALPFTNSNRSNIVIVNFGANDANAGRTSATIIAKLQAMANYIIAAGATPIICTMMPRVTATGIYSGSGSAWAGNDTKRQVQAEVNASILGGSWCGAGQAIEIADMNQGIVDGGTLDSFGGATIPLDYMTESDGLHPGTLGAWYRYVQIQAAIDRIFATKGWGSSYRFTSDCLDATNLLVTTNNPGLTGTSGAKSGTGVSGTIAGNSSASDGSFAVIRGGANASTTNVSVAGSVENISTGKNKQVLAFTASVGSPTAVGSGANSAVGLYDYESFVWEFYKSGIYISLPAAATAGLYVRVLLDIECLSASGFPGFSTLSLDTNFYKSDNSQTGLAFKGGAAGKFGNSSYDHLPATFSTTLITEPLLIPANAAKFSSVLTIATLNGFSGTGTLKISQPRMIAVTDPTTVWAAA